MLQQYVDFNETGHGLDFQYVFDVVYTYSTFLPMKYMLSCNFQSIVIVFFQLRSLGKTILWWMLNYIYILK